MLYNFSLTLSLNPPLHLNVTILLFFNIISSPVAGFLPLRGDFSLTWNLPKPDIIISSPDANVDFMISRRVSKVSFASDGGWLFFSDIFWMIVVLVQVVKDGCSCIFYILLHYYTSRDHFSVVISQGVPDFYC